MGESSSRCFLCCLQIQSGQVQNIFNILTMYCRLIQESFHWTDPVLLARQIMNVCETSKYD